VIEAEANQIKEVPNELGQLKKLKSLKLDGNPIKDGKVVRMLSREGKGLKELLKYLSEAKSAKPKKASQTTMEEEDKVEEEGEEGNKSSELELDDDDI